MIALGFDTSNYTTSAALFGQDVCKNVSRLLPVKEGQLGLRQSDAVFSHVNALGGIVNELFSEFDADVCAVGYSAFPRRVEGSYMPCFKVGEMAAQLAAAQRKIPLYEFSHQEGHLAAALVTTDNEELFEREFLAWHLSGGTTELLHVEPNLVATKIGGTTDISAGQLVDRTGVRLGLGFPAGRALDEMAREDVAIFKVREKDYSFSLSGMENKVNEHKGESDEIAGFVLGTIADILARVTRSALKEFGDIPVVISGGVAGSKIVRARLKKAIFCEPKYSSDNALGIASLALRRYLKENRV